MPAKMVWSLDFACELCKSPLTLYVEDDPPTNQQALREVQFHFQCFQPDCIWKGSKYGREAIQISSAPFPFQADSTLHIYGK